MAEEGEVTLCWKPLRVPWIGDPFKDESTHGIRSRNECVAMAEQMNGLLYAGQMISQHRNIRNNLVLCIVYLNEKCRLQKTVRELRKGNTFLALKVLYPEYLKKCHVLKATAIYIYNIYIYGLVQERCNSSASTLEVHLYCTNPSIWCQHCTSRLYMALWGGQYILFCFTSNQSQWLRRRKQCSIEGHQGPMNWQTF